MSLSAIPPGSIPPIVAGDQLPEFKSRPSLDYPYDLRKAGELGYAMVGAAIDPKGHRLNLFLHASHPYYQRAVGGANDELDLRPAKKNGQPVESLAWFAVIFNPASAKAKGPNATPRLLAVAPVVVTRTISGPTKPQDSLVVWATVSLDENGVPQHFTLTTPEDEKFRPAIEGSLPQWRFAPARRGGTAVAADVRVPFLIQPPAPAHSLEKTTPPKVLKRVRPFYPPSLIAQRLRGEVVVAFEVTTDGHVDNVVVIRSNNPAFEKPAIEAVRKWTFEPGKKEGKPIKAKLQVSLTFQHRDQPDGGEEIVQLSGHVDQSKLPPEFRYDVAPKPHGIIAPVYPYELLSAEVNGSATVVIVVGLEGKPTEVAVSKATHPEFGQALTAAIEQFTFEPGLKDGHPTQTLLRHEQEFDSGRRENLLTDEDFALLKREKKKPETIVGAGKLDTPLKPISRRAPTFPLALRGKIEKGDAKIEILVDEAGKARLPRIVSASDPAFGYAAVQAVAAWQFDPPTVGGKKAVTRVQVPFHFAVKAASPTATPVPAKEAAPVAKSETAPAPN